MLSVLLFCSPSKSHITHWHDHIYMKRKDHIKCVLALFFAHIIICFQRVLYAFSSLNICVRAARLYSGNLSIRPINTFNVRQSQVNKGVIILNYVYCFCSAVVCNV